MMPHARAARLPWKFLATMPSYAAGTPLVLGSSSVNTWFNRPSACSCARQASLTWSSHSIYDYHEMRALSLAVVPGSLGQRKSSYMVGAVTATAV